jgi:hypothetical protein
VHLRAFKRIDDATRSLAADTNAALMTARFDFANQDLKIARLKAGQLQRDVELARSRNLISTVLLAGAAIVLACCWRSGWCRSGAAATPCAPRTSSSTN